MHYVPKIKSLELPEIQQTPEYFYSSEEVTKLIKAFQDKYNISPCDELPYKPKYVQILLQGTIKENENHVAENKGLHS